MEQYLINKPGKYEVSLQLSKEGEKKEWLGIIEAHEAGDYDLSLKMSHFEKDTFGRVMIKGVAENGAIIRIKGLVRIENRAQGADSFLATKILLLDKKSGAIVEPELEILADRVKAGHAASVGKVDEEQLFYLMSRGMTEIEARKLLVKGFLRG